MTRSRFLTLHSVRAFFFLDLELEEITLIDGGISANVTEGNCLGTNS